jgi:hypothetical protein
LTSKARPVHYDANARCPRAFLERALAGANRAFTSADVAVPINAREIARARLRRPPATIASFAAANHEPEKNE